MELTEALRILAQLRGIRVVRMLSDTERAAIREHEEERNTGVLECLTRKHVVLVSHDSMFRMPPAPIVIADAENSCEFPAVAFPEIEGAISSSPSGNVHALLTRGIDMDEEEATLLIGFD